MRAELRDGLEGLWEASLHQRAGCRARTPRDSDVHLPLHQMLRSGITRQISDALVAARVSTLRYDKRGVGASGGDYLSVGMAQRLADARAALGWLATAAAGVPLLAIGHSEGTY
jgi:uncharacterized protein